MVTGLDRKEPLQTEWNAEFLRTVLYQDLFGGGASNIFSQMGYPIIYYD